jgi:hypothetical protein
MASVGLDKAKEDADAVALSLDDLDEAVINEEQPPGNPKLHIPGLRLLHEIVDFAGRKWSCGDARIAESPQGEGLCGALPGRRRLKIMPSRHLSFLRLRASSFPAREKCLQPRVGQSGKVDFIVSKKTDSVNLFENDPGKRLLQTLTGSQDHRSVSGKTRQ